MDNFPWLVIQTFITFNVFFYLLTLRSLKGLRQPLRTRKGKKKR